MKRIKLAAVAGIFAVHASFSYGGISCSIDSSSSNYFGVTISKAYVEDESSIGGAKTYFEFQVLTTSTTGFSTVLNALLDKGICDSGPKIGAVSFTNADLENASTASVPKNVTITTGNERHIPRCNPGQMRVGSGKIPCTCAGFGEFDITAVVSNYSGSSSGATFKVTLNAIRYDIPFSSTTFTCTVPYS